MELRVVACRPTEEEEDEVQEHRLRIVTLLGDQNDEIREINKAITRPFKPKIHVFWKSKKKRVVNITSLHKGLDTTYKCAAEIKFKPTKAECKHKLQ